MSSSALHAAPIASPVTTTSIWRLTIQPGLNESKVPSSPGVAAQRGHGSAL